MLHNPLPINLLPILCEIQTARHPACTYVTQQIITSTGKSHAEVTMDWYRHSHTAYSSAARRADSHTASVLSDVFESFERIDP